MKAIINMKCNFLAIIAGNCRAYSTVAMNFKAACHEE